MGRGEKGQGVTRVGMAIRADGSCLGILCMFISYVSLPASTPENYIRLKCRVLFLTIYEGVGQKSYETRF